MRFTLRLKILLIFSIFLLVGGAAWSLNFDAYRQLTHSLQLLEEKNKFLNWILETRRYEKNYFLSGGRDNLAEAITFARKAHEQLRLIADRSITNGGVRDDFPRLLEALGSYQKSLEDLIAPFSGVRQSGLGASRSADLQVHLATVRGRGNFLTTEAETMVRNQQSVVGKLLEQKKKYHYIALAEIVGLCVFTVFFLFFSVNRPLRAIENGIAKIARGDYENLPSTSKGDEFEDLVVSLNHMLDEINRRTDQLIQSKKMASLGTLTSGVAHELNNPINNISTTLQILLEELEDGDIDYQRMQLEEAEKQVERARDIVKALLEFSRETDFSIQEVCLQDLIENTLKLIRGEVPADVEIETELPPDIKMALDPRTIQQVLINLIINGIQAMPHGGKLYIRGFESPDAEEVCIQVQDTGSGISPEDLPKIFDPFFSTKEVGHGTGLGLSVSHGIVKKHGGRINVESDLGKGTTFTLFLKARPESAPGIESGNPGPGAAVSGDAAGKE
ncbi:MAG: HAMP domain-containing protein [Desulfobacteraceae bacterium]|nr:HAMP domain-containing protein [Desulfobacteraceae bacterium]